MGARPDGFQDCSHLTAPLETPTKSSRCSCWIADALLLQEHEIGAGGEAPAAPSASPSGLRHGQASARSNGLGVEPAKTTLSVSQSCERGTKWVQAAPGTLRTANWMAGSTSVWT